MSGGKKRGLILTDPPVLVVSNSAFEAMENEQCCARCKSSFIVTSVGIIVESPCGHVLCKKCHVSWTEDHYDDAENVPCWHECDVLNSEFNVYFVQYQMGIVLYAPCNTMKSLTYSKADCNDEMSWKDLGTHQFEIELKNVINAQTEKKLEVAVSILSGVKRYRIFSEDKEHEEILKDEYYRLQEKSANAISNIKKIQDSLKESEGSHTSDALKINQKNALQADMKEWQAFSKYYTVSFSALADVIDVIQKNAAMEDKTDN